MRYNKNFGRRRDGMNARSTLSIRLAARRKVFAFSQHSREREIPSRDHRITTTIMLKDLDQNGKSNYLTSTNRGWLPVASGDAKGLRCGKRPIRGATLLKINMRFWNRLAKQAPAASNDATSWPTEQREREAGPRRNIAKCPSSPVE